MEFKICYNPKIGKYFEFVSTNKQDKKLLKSISDEMTSAGYQFGSLSICSQICQINIPVNLTKKA